MKDQKVDQFLKATQVAEVLNISRAQAYILMKSTIPSIRFGKTVRVRKSDLEKFIAQSMNEEFDVDDAIVSQALVGGEE